MINNINPSVLNTIMVFGIGLVGLRLLFIGGAILECLTNRK